MSNWTDIPPTETGWYWWRFMPGSLVQVIHIHEAHGAFWVSDSSGVHVLNIGHTSGQWWPTPIEPPKG